VLLPLSTKPTACEIGGDCVTDEVGAAFPVIRSLLNESTSRDARICPEGVRSGLDWSFAGADFGSEGSILAKVRWKGFEGASPVLLSERPCVCQEYCLVSVINCSSSLMTPVRSFDGPGWALTDSPNVSVEDSENIGEGEPGSGALSRPTRGFVSSGSAACGEWGDVIRTVFLIFGGGVDSVSMFE
jgi:hypothetical protein